MCRGFEMRQFQLGWQNCTLSGSELGVKGHGTFPNGRRLAELLVLDQAETDSANRRGRGLRLKEEDCQSIGVASWRRFYLCVCFEPESFF